jgi:hypothetical protein
MNQLMSITWAQSILIEVGAVLQIVAIVALIKQRLSHRMLPTIGEEVPRKDDEETESNFSKFESPVNENWAPASPRHEEAGPMKASYLAKTSKVKFKQSFKFRE